MTTRLWPCERGKNKYCILCNLLSSELEYGGAADKGERCRCGVVPADRGSLREGEKMSARLAMGGMFETGGSFSMVTVDLNREALSKDASPSLGLLPALRREG